MAVDPGAVGGVALGPQEAASVAEPADLAPSLVGIARFERGLSVQPY